ncbi:MAG: ATP-binding protein [Anaerolineae bacterium]|nr:ATP-binding protein [Anaerolineae bacterium]
MSTVSLGMEQLMLELEWVQLRVRNLLESRPFPQNDPGSMLGYVIPDDEILELLSMPVSQWEWGTPENQTSTSAESALFKRLAAVRAEAQRLGVNSPLDTVATTLELSPLDIRLLVLAAAPSLDRRFERLYGYLQDDITQTHLSIDLGLRLLGYGLQQLGEVLARLRADSPLIHYHLLQLQSHPHLTASIFKQTLQISEQCLNFLLGHDTLDPRLTGIARTKLPTVIPDNLVLSESLRQILDTLVQPHSDPMIGYFQGPAGYGKETVAEACCQLRGQTILTIDGTAFLRQAKSEWNDLLARIRLVARLHQSVMYWERADLLCRELGAVFMAAIVDCTKATGLCILSGETYWPAEQIAEEMAFFPIQFDLPTYPERLRLWRQMVGQEVGFAAGQLENLASQFRLSPGQISQAVRAARDMARLRGVVNPTPTPSEIYAACRAQLDQHMADLGQKITPRHGWTDLVLPAEPHAHLRALCDAVRSRGKVLDEWGFDGKLTVGRGINALFAGPSGTGKTMAAEVIAAELQMDLYKIDLSSVVSKYIGETEKNLKRVFDSAEQSQCLLLLDEADALFGKRTEVRDSHDRYANIEVNYLLQRIEEYDGVAILATNLRKNMDEAFVRRLMYIVDFPFPTAEDRLRIWQSIWPSNAPLADDISFEALAEQLEIAGGHIRNIALAAAFQAAAEGEYVQMTHLTVAAHNELMKIGKIMTN